MAVGVKLDGVTRASNRRVAVARQIHLKIVPLLLRAAVCDFFGCITLSKNIACDTRHTGRNCYRLQSITVHKRPFTDRCDSVRDLKVGQTSICKCPSSNASNPRWKFNLCECRTKAEHMVRNSGQLAVLGKSNTLQRGTPIKCRRSDAGNSGWNRNFRQRATMPECLFSNAGQLAVFPKDNA